MDVATPVFLEYRDALIRFIQSKVKDPVDQTDLLSEVMVKLYANAEKLPTIRNVEAWLIAVARNTITDYFRDLQKRRAESLPHDLSESDKDDLFSQLDGCVPALIQRLPPKYAEPLADYELHGIPQKVLALRYGLSESGLKSRIQRSRRKLKSLFQDSCLDVLEGTKRSSDCNCA